MDEDDVLVEKENVRQEDEDLNDERHEEPNKSGTSCILEIYCQFENVSMVVLISQIKDGDQEEVEDREEPIPGQGFAEGLRKAADPVIRYP